MAEGGIFQPKVVSANGSTGSRTFVGRRLVVPLLVIGVVFVGCLVIMNTAQSRLTTNVSDKLEKLRDATEIGLTIWLESREDAVAIAANAKEVRELARRLVTMNEEGGGAGAAVQDTEEFRRLRTILSGTAARYGTGDFVVVAASGVTVASLNPSIVGTDLPWSRTDAARRALAGEALVSRPFLSPFAGQSIGASTRERATMFALAPIRDDAGEPFAVLGLRLEPESGFSQVLNAARIGKSGEAYLVDREGRMLTMSRFERELVGHGILQPDQSSVLTVELVDPGCDLTAGAAREDGVECHPTKLMAGLEAGIENPTSSAGTDADGYPDYRGVRVVGAWKWLPKYEMGLAVELDHDEAYEGMNLVRMILIGVLVLLLASVSTVMLGSVALRRLRRRIDKSRQLGQYTIERKIGRGGMGQVYLARHALLKRPTALKVMESPDTDKEDLHRFEREVQLTSQLSHPNTIQIYDYGHTPDGVFYYVMEYLEGLDLESLVKRFGPSPPGRVVRILDQICASLEEAHERGFVHRDVKPANVILCERGGMPDVVKVLDFGLVKDLGGSGRVDVTRHDALAGTPGYLAPEVIRQPRAADARSDVYCVAAIGYYLLTGKQVFGGTTVMQVLEGHLHREPPPPSTVTELSVPAGLEEVIMRGLVKDPDERVQSATEFRRRLRNSGVTWHEQLAHSWWDAHRDCIRSEADDASDEDDDVQELVTIEIDQESRGEL